MLPRLWSVLLLAVIVVAQDNNQETVEDVSDKVVSEIDTRPRGERAEDGDLPPPRRRPRPGGSSSFGSFLSGFLGSVTKTASADGCPGKCIHALASLMCDSVLEDIQCPARNMRCCVEKSGGASRPKPPPRENKNPLDSLLELELPPRPEDNKLEEKKDEVVEDEEEEEEEEEEKEPVEKKKKKKKRRKTTTEATTTTTTTEKATTSKASSKDDDSKGSNSTLSRFYSSNATLSLVFVSLLTFLQTAQNI